MVDRVFLPTDNSLVHAQGTLVIDTSVVDPPDASGPDSSEEISTDQTWGGKATWKLTRDGTGGDNYWSYTLPTPVSCSGNKPSLWVPLYVTDYTAHYGPDIDVRIGDSWDNWLRHEISLSATGATSLRRNGWHMIHITPDHWDESYGSPNFNDDVEAIRFHIPGSPTVSGAQFFVGPVYLGIRTRPQLLIYDDASYYNFHEYVLPIMDELGLKAHIVVAKHWVDTSVFQTTAQLASALAGGHYISGHTGTRVGTGYGAPTIAEAIADIKMNNDYVRDVIGDTENYNHWTWANGQYWFDDRSDAGELLEALRQQLGVMVSRAAEDVNLDNHNTMLGLETFEGKDHLQSLRCFGVWGGSSPDLKTDAGLIAAVDRLIEQDGTGCLLLHDFADESGSTVEDNLTQMRNLLEHIRLRYDEGLLALPRANDLDRIRPRVTLSMAKPD